MWRFGSAEEVDASRCPFHVHLSRNREVPSALQSPDPKTAPLRYSVGMHRMSQEVTDFGGEQWGQLSRAQRTRKCMPCKLMLTVFARPREVADPPPLQPVPQSRGVEDLERLPAQPLRPGDERRDLHVRVQPSDLCEGWGPPPVPLHGPKFRALDVSRKQELIQLHKNLGHPDPQKLASHLRARKSLPEVIEAALDYVCDTCVESTKPRHQRPGKLHDPQEFNQTVGLDGFFWSGKAGFQVHVFHCLDEASLFQIGRRIEHRDSASTISIWQDMWTSWAGMPQSIYADPAGEFVSQEWVSFLQGHNVSAFITDAPWQKGRVERHGQVLKDMLHRFDQDRPIRDVLEFDRVLRTCCQAKNAMVRHEGYSPEQIVLGRSTPLPASLTSDDCAVSHGLAVGSSLASEKFRAHLECRSLARKAFVLADNEAAIRRALHRRSCPTRGPFEPGQQVMFWHKRSPANRLEAGRWCGPATVMSQVGQSVVWLSFHDRVFRCAPESLRPASLREWQSQGSLAEHVRVEQQDPERRPPIADVHPEPAIENIVSRNLPVSGPPRQMSQPESEIPPEPRLSPGDETNLVDPGNSADAELSVPADNDPPQTLDLEGKEASTFWCLEVPEDEPDVFCQEPLFEWLTFHAGSSESAEVCLAADGLPLIHDP